MAAVTICSDFGAQENTKSLTVATVSPFICHEVMGPDLYFLNVKFLASFFTFFLHFHQEAL